MKAVAVCFIASVLITSSPIIFGEPMASGWITPALPLVIGFFMTKGLFQVNIDGDISLYGCNVY